jgi:hypothetical protein
MQLRLVNNHADKWLLALAARTFPKTSFNIFSLIIHLFGISCNPTISRNIEQFNNNIYTTEIEITM